MTIDVAFTGTIVRDGELKVSKAGKNYVRFTARDGDGDHVSWVNCMYFGSDAAELAPRMLKNTRIYVEGTLKLDRWEKGGAPQSGLSVMSFHARIPAIGRNKPAAKRKSNITSVDVATPSSAVPSSGRGDFYDDSIPFAPEWRG
jgi:single-stranded DNA-binding protein